MSLIKIPILLCMTALAHICLTPPNKAPPQPEQYIPTASRPRQLELALRKFIANFWLMKLMYWCTALTECIAILVAAFPDVTGSDFLASRLSFNGRPFPSHVAHPTPIFVFASALTIIAFIGRILSYNELGFMFTFELARKRDHKLVTTGPYAIVRHPSYAGAMFGVLGSVVCFMGRNSWIKESGFIETVAGVVFVGVSLGVSGFGSVLAVIRLRSEDDFLRNEFGVVWEKWAKEVPFKLVPGVY
ncbi:hypothetical protein CPB85DRAFT_1374275 [Mucidula mucida]|nr:hypothetical protein CPB85DRAFT_1374275 [Mucidula mucida]